MADTPAPPTMTDAPAPEGMDMPAPAESMDSSAPTEGAPGIPEIPTDPTKAPEHKGAEGEIEKIADDYVIPMSDGAIKSWAKAGPEEFKKYAEQVAQGMYPNFAAQIAAGIPTRILLDPYIQVAQQVLGPVMSEPNWSDPKWSAALQGGIDPKTNRPIPMTLDEWRKHLMTHPGHGWDKSPQAHERAAQFNQIINQAFSTPGGQQ